MCKYVFMCRHNNVFNFVVSYIILHYSNIKVLRLFFPLSPVYIKINLLTYLLTYKEIFYYSLESSQESSGALYY